MMIEIILIGGLFFVVAVVGLVLFSLRVVRISIREAKPNLTININQTDSKPDIKDISELIGNFNNFLNTIDVKKLDDKSKNDNE